MPGLPQLTGLFLVCMPAGGIPFLFVSLRQSRASRSGKRLPVADGAVPALSADAALSRGYALLLLVTVLAQTFFTFVRSHLVAFSFLSAWHIC